MANIGVAGSGFSGAVVARQLADAGHRVTVFEPRPHIGGNCYTERRDGIVVHVYGPHIFHTADPLTWQWIQRWTVMVPYQHRVLARADGRIWQLPINLATINQLYGANAPMDPAEARRFMDELTRPARERGIEPVTFEDQAMQFVGRDLYHLLLEHYTRKQWGVHPRLLPASVLKRLPVRFTYENSYYDHRYQGMPVDGYTPIFEGLLDHPSIRVNLSAPMSRADVDSFDWTFWTGSIDGYFGFDEGRLGYRTLRFDVSWHDGDFQGCAQLNYCDPEPAWTRVTEHKFLAPWEHHDRTVVSHEHATACGPDDEPYYPLRLATDMPELERYVARAREEPRVSFIGRLGTYRYLDMDVCIREALDAAERWLTGDRRPFYV